MPAVLHTLTDRKDLLTNEIYLLSAVTALQRVTETLPHFISPYLQDTTVQVSSTRKPKQTTQHECDTARLAPPSGQCLQKLGVFRVCRRATFNANELMFILR